MQVIVALAFCRDLRECRRSLPILKYHFLPSYGDHSLNVINPKAHQASVTVHFQSDDDRYAKAPSSLHGRHYTQGSSSPLGIEL
jgi:hypothetical protein